MFHFYNGYHLFGMHLLWWAFWIAIVLFVFFAFKPKRRTNRRTNR